MLGALSARTCLALKEKLSMNTHKPAPIENISISNVNVDFPTNKQRLQAAHNAAPNSPAHKKNEIDLDNVASRSIN